MINKIRLPFGDYHSHNGLSVTILRLSLSSHATYCSLLHSCNGSRYFLLRLLQTKSWEYVNYKIPISSLTNSKNVMRIRGHACRQFFFVYVNTLLSFAKNSKSIFLKSIKKSFNCGQRIGNFKTKKLIVI